MSSKNSKSLSKRSLLAVVALFISSTALASDNGLCVGDPVALTDGREGIVIGITHSGRVLVNIRGYSSIGNYSLDQVASERPDACREGLCPNDPVGITDGRDGTVAGITRSGRVLVRNNGYSSLLGPYDRSNIGSSRSDACRDGVCPRDSVATADGHAGVVVGITPDGGILVRDPGYSSLFGPYSRDEVGVSEPGRCIDLEGCLHRVSFLSNSDSGGRLLAARISQTQSKTIAVMREVSNYEQQDTSGVMAARAN